MTLRNKSSSAVSFTNGSLYKVDACKSLDNLQQLHTLTNCGQIIIYDTEYTAWEGSAERNWSLPWEHRELIQIGAVKMDLHPIARVVESFTVIIRPGINCKLSSYIMKLTGITQKMVDKEGVDFADAIVSFYNFASAGSLPLLSYGDDFEIIIRNARLYGAPLPDFTSGAYDIRPLFEDCGIDTSRYSSGTVHQSFSIPFGGAAHDALNDATSVALTLEQLVNSNTAWREAAERKSAA
ncbi:MAG: exonuclease domain-containing protein [Deltaproteobacteria bacterium]|nr:exonuclease domain-containing protein [Deltaproteobacteria bacterium]